MRSFAGGSPVRSMSAASYVSEVMLRSRSCGSHPPALHQCRHRASCLVRGCRVGLVTLRSPSRKSPMTSSPTKTIPAALRVWSDLRAPSHRSRSLSCGPRGVLAARLPRWSSAVGTLFRAKGTGSPSMRMIRQSPAVNDLREVSLHDLRVVHEEFCRWFGSETAGSAGRYAQIADETWQLWQARRGAGQAEGA